MGDQRFLRAHRIRSNRDFQRAYRRGARASDAWLVVLGHENGLPCARLGLSSTIHEGKYDEGDFSARIDAYDHRRAAIHPYKPRDPARWGDVPFYGWSEDKARQYGVPQRADFGAFVRGKGFCLD